MADPSRRSSPRGAPRGGAGGRAGAGILIVGFLFSGPSRAGLLHADPHPGNFRLLDDGRLGVLDFGAVARMPGGHPEPLGRLTRLPIAGRAEEVLAGLRAEGFVRGDVEVDAQEVLNFVAPILVPLTLDEFQ